MIDLLKNNKVIVCAGTGGVGKTSLSASLGVWAAQSGLRTLVLTIDPARRLAQALGIDSRAGEEVAVADCPGLTASMIDPRREFDQFVLGSVDKGLAKGLFENRLYQQLVSNLNGSQEFTSLVRLLAASRSGEYDLVILDTPPAQNAVDFLKSPERLYALFQDSVIGWFATSDQRGGFIKRTLHRGTRLVTRALETVTGSTFIAELKDFFSHISHLQKQVALVSQQAGELLQAPNTGFILVTGFDQSKLKEALEFQADLEQEKLRLLAVVINRWLPEWQEADPSGPWEQDPDYKVLAEFYTQFAKFFKLRQEACAKFEAKVNGRAPVLKLPDFKFTVQGLSDLRAVAEVLSAKWEEKR